MTTIRERAKKLAVRTVARIAALPAAYTTIHTEYRIIADEFEYELELHEAFRIKVNTMLKSLREDFEQLGFPTEALILASFMKEIEGDRP